MAPASGAKALLDELHALLVQLDGTTTGGVAMGDDEVVIADGTLRLRVSLPEPEPDAHPGVVHAHVVAVLTGARAAVLPACIVTVRQSGNPFHDAARRWLALAAPPVLSFLWDREVLGARRFSGNDVHGAPGCRGFAGALGVMTISPEAPSGNVDGIADELAVQPLFLHAGQLADDGGFHIAKATFQSSETGWNRSLEVDGHVASIPFSPWPPSLPGVAREGGGRTGEPIAAAFAVFASGGGSGQGESAGDVDDALDRMMRFYAARPANQWDFFPEEIARAGVGKELAAELHRFAPLAFGRQILVELGVSLPQECFMIRDDGSFERLALGDNRAYRHACRAAPGYRHAAKFGDAFTGVALISSEIAAVNQALNGGSAVGDLALMPPVFTPGDMDRGALERVYKLVSSSHTSSKSALGIVFWPKPPAKNRPCRRFFLVWTRRSEFVNTLLDKAWEGIRAAFPTTASSGRRKWWRFWK